MKRVSWMKWGVPLLLAGALGMTGAQAADEQAPSSYGSGYGPGMMGGGYGMSRGGYGAGMMDGDWGGGYGNGYGWGGYGRGRGTSGFGMGWGGGMMMGGGMTGLGALWSLKLSDQQRHAIEDILNRQHTLHWSMMSALFADYGKLNDLYNADHWDAEAIGKVYDDIFRNQRAMIESGVKAHNRIYDQLTKEQKEQLHRYDWGGGWGR